MLFNSQRFVIFFAIVYTLYLLARDRVQQNIIILVASYVFYAWAAPRYLVLLIFYTLATFGIAIGIDRATTPLWRRVYLIAGIAVNLGVLGYFKYANFFITEVSAVLVRVGFAPHPTVLNILLPIGVSFFTFQSLAYLIDVYRRVSPATTDLLTFAVFKAFFPQLVAGPIERAHNMMPQIAAPRTLTASNILQGVYWVLLGFFLKCVIADRVAPIVDYNFSILDGPNRGPLAALNGILGFTLQIYGDFAGYTYIALGTARLMGFQLQRNFLAPYLATSLQDFWRRWHVTLSFWLRDYLYVPLGGSRRGTVRTYANLLLTMALGGLWHGASWNFVIWGIYHGCGLAIQRTVSPYLGWIPDVARSVGGWALTLFFVMFGWVLFRASSMSEFTDIIGRLTHAGPVTSTDLQAFLVLLAFSVIVILVQRIEEFDPVHAPKMSELARPVRVGAFALMFLAVFAVGFGEYRFIYFQF